MFRAKRFISETYLFALPDLNVWVQRADCSLPLPHAIFDSKVLWSINHDALGIERCPTSTVGVIGLLPEVFLAARFHIFHQNGNKEVPVRSRLLVHSS